MINKLRALLSFCRDYHWVDEPKWLEEDEKVWTAFLGTPTGKRLSLILLNLTIRQNATAVMEKPDRLAGACGRANGYRACVATLESLASTKINSAIAGYGDGEDEPVAN